MVGNGALPLCHPTKVVRCWDANFHRELLVTGAPTRSKHGMRHGRSAGKRSIHPWLLEPRAGLFGARVRAGRGRGRHRRAENLLNGTQALCIPSPLSRKHLLEFPCVRTKASKGRIH